MQKNNIDTDIEAYKKAIESDPLNINACFILGNIYNENNKFSQAIEYYNKAIEINPAYAIIYNNLGIAYAQNNEHNKAVKSFEKAIELGHNEINTYNYAGISYNRLELYEKALEYFNKALNIDPNFASTYIYMGNCYYDEEKFDKAIECFQIALKLSPDSFEAYNNLGNSYKEAEEYDLAINCYNRVLQINPDFFEAFINLGASYYCKRDFDKAEAYYKKAIEYKPDYGEAYNNLSTVYRMKADFEKGWELFEWRFKLRADNKNRLILPDIEQPAWNGSSIKDKTIYVYWEQGFGDTLMFVRYLPVLAAMGARVLFKPQKELEKFLRQNDLSAEIISPFAVDSNVKFDEHISLMSIPGILKTDLTNIPYSEGYLKANPEKTKVYFDKYFNNDKFKIGVFWQGSPRGFKRRATKLENFYKFAKIKNVQLYSLQKGYGIEQLKEIPEEINIIDLGSEFSDYSDTAAAIANLDLVITIDTSVAHLSAAMQKETWVMLNADNEWRWLVEGETTNWYKNIRLFRQKCKNNWEETFENVFEELNNKIIIKNI